MQFVGLFMFIVILFPVISVTDDIWLIQSPAETKTFQSHDEHAASVHSVFPGMAALPDRAASQLSLHPQRFGALFDFSLLAFDNPALDPLQNRPPPWA